MITLSLSVLVAVLSLVGAVLHKKGSNAAAVVDTIVTVLKQLLIIFQGSSDPVLRAKVLDEMRTQLRTLDSIGTKEAKLAANEIRYAISLKG